MIIDERIEGVKTKIYRNAIIISLFVAVLSLVIKLIENINIANIILEIIIIISSIFIIGIDFSRFSGEINDERLKSLRLAYYIKAFRNFLVLILVGFAITVGIAFQLYSSSLAPNYLIISLQTILFIYFVYNFKKNTIFFNYSFIDQDNKTYYKQVFINILKVVKIAAVIYAIAFFIAFIISGSLASIGPILLVNIIAFLSSVLSIGLYYLFISFIDKLFYNEEESKKRYLKSSITLLILLILITLALLFLRIDNIIFIENITNNPNATLIGQQIAKYGQQMTYLNFIKNFLLTTLIGIPLYLMSKAKLNIKGIKVIFLAFVLTFIMSQISPLAHIILNRQDASANRMFHLYSVVNHWINIIISMISIIGLFILTRVLIKELKYSKYLIALPITSLVIQTLIVILPLIPNAKEIYLAILFYILTIPPLIIFVVIKKTDIDDQVTIIEI